MTETDVSASERSRSFGWRRDATARQRALQDVAADHPHEFTARLAVRREELGLPPELPGFGYHLDADRLRQGWLGGETIESMAEEFNCSPGTVRSHARRLGLPKRKSGWNMTARAAMSTDGEGRLTTREDQP